MFVAAFTAVVPNHEGAEAKLVEFATDRVASIREKAAGGLAVLTSSTAECVLAGRTKDPCTEGSRPPRAEFLWGRIPQGQKFPRGRIP